METFTEDQVAEIIRNLVDGGERDLQGQIVIYTGVFVHQDGSYHDQPDPDLPDDEEEA